MALMRIPSNMTPTLSQFDLKSLINTGTELCVSNRIKPSAVFHDQNLLIRFICLQLEHLWESNPRCATDRNIRYLSLIKIEIVIGQLHCQRRLPSSTIIGFRGFINLYVSTKLNIHLSWNFFDNTFVNSLKIEQVGSRIKEKIHFQSKLQVFNVSALMVKDLV